MTYLISRRFSLPQLVLLLLLAMLTACGSQGTPPGPAVLIGVVEETKGFPSVIRGQRTYLLAKQSRIYQGDIIETDRESKIKLKMLDDTTFALGPNSHFVLHEYKYSETESAPVAQMSLTSGSLRSKTAKLMQARRPSFKINTPQALIGIRGTDFWSGFIFGDNTLDVAMIEGRGVYVTNQHGTAELDFGGFGTTVSGAAPPRPPKRWPQRKIDRALAETGF